MHLLLVEDDPRDIELLTEAFQRGGAQVTVAQSDLEAYRLMATPAVFDLLVADVNLGPGTTGFDVARSARIRWPGLPVAYMTAHAIEISAHAVAGSRSFVKLAEVARLAEAVLAFAREAQG